MSDTESIESVKLAPDAHYTPEQLLVIEESAAQVAAERIATGAREGCPFGLEVELGHLIHAGIVDQAGGSEYSPLVLIGWLAAEIMASDVTEVPEVTS